MKREIIFFRESKALAGRSTREGGAASQRKFSAVPPPPRGKQNLRDAHKFAEQICIKQDANKSNRRPIVRRVGYTLYAKN